MRSLSRLCVTIIVLLFLVAPASAQGVSEERIISFVSDITVARNGDLTVTETITVQATGDRIKRGIYRDFPTRYPDSYGNSKRVRFDVLDVKRDGKKEPFALEDIQDGVRVRIGVKDVFLKAGKHTYSIRYITDQHISFLGNNDVLYWNVTGNGWEFGIDRTEVRIRLPDGADINQHAFYTGPFGSRGSDAVAQIRKNRAHFHSIRQFAPGEGLTVAIGFQKGVVKGEQ